MIAKRLIAGVLCSLLSARAFAANLISNPSFETPYFGTGFTFYQIGSTSITGWTVVGGEIGIVPANMLAPSDGLQWIDLTGNFGYDKGLRSDNVTTVIGSTYRVSFDIGDYNSPGFGNATLGVSVNGGTEMLFNNVYTSGVMDWKRSSFDWVADSTSANLTFTGRANGALSNDAGIGLDKVSVDLVPEPGTCTMLLVGLLGLSARRRRQPVA